MTRREKLRRKGLRCGAKGHWPKMLEEAVWHPHRRPFSFNGVIGFYVARCRECGTRMVVEDRITTEELAASPLSPRVYLGLREDAARHELERQLTRGSRW